MNNQNYSKILLDVDRKVDGKLPNMPPRSVEVIVLLGNGLKEYIGEYNYHLLKKREEGISLDDSFADLMRHHNSSLPKLELDELGVESRSGVVITIENGGDDSV
ncbi:hypothetical protein AKO1_007757, partial [Acrasis kona]